MMICFLRCTANCRQVLNGRRCFKTEPNVDYDVDSDEDWQEEPEGESLSVSLLCMLLLLLGREAQSHRMSVQHCYLSCYGMASII